MKIYISGPISDSPDYKKKFNDAYNHLKELYGSDIAIIDPTALPDPAHLVWKEYMKQDIMHLLTCDTIYMLKGWTKSKGALLEYHIAEALSFNLLFECSNDYVDDYIADKISLGECL